MRRPEAEARAIFAMAEREGLIPREPCCVCGAPWSPARKGHHPSVVRHHPDLCLRPLYTIPLCLAHHAQVHAGKLVDPGLGALRPTIDFAARAQKSAATRRGARGRAPSSPPPSRPSIGTDESSGTPGAGLLSARDVTARRVLPVRVAR